VCANEWKQTFYARSVVFKRLVSFNTKMKISKKTRVKEMFSGTLAKHKFEKYWKASEITNDESLKVVLKDFSNGKTNLPVLIFRSGYICLKVQRKKKYILVHYDNDVETILKECER
jgi:hypothetical protein